MKHRIITVVIAIALLVISTAGVNADSGLTWKTRKAHKGYVTTFYSHGRAAGKIKTAKKLPVKVVAEKKCTAGKVNKRRGRYILVEKISGKCIDNNGNGKTSAGYYIKYKGAHKGDKFTTFAVYADSKYIDDITIRVDERK